MVSDADFACGALVLRERFLLRGPAELPPLEMFRPVPQQVGTVEIQGEARKRVMIWDNLWVIHGESMVNPWLIMGYTMIHGAEAKIDGA